jgi:hypothetical protein
MRRLPVQKMHRPPPICLGPYVHAGASKLASCVPWWLLRCWRADPTIHKFYDATRQSAMYFLHHIKVSRGSPPTSLGKATVPNSLLKVKNVSNLRDPNRCEGWLANGRQQAVTARRPALRRGIPNPSGRPLNAPASFIHPCQPSVAKGNEGCCDDRD